MILLYIYGRTKFQTNANTRHNMAALILSYMERQHRFFNSIQQSLSQALPYRNSITGAPNSWQSVWLFIFIIADIF